MNKIFLQELIVANLWGAAQCRAGEDPYLSFTYDGSYLEYSCTTKIISGGCCWEEGEETYTSQRRQPLAHLNYHDIHEILSQFRLAPEEVSQLPVQEMLEYYDYIKKFHIAEDTEERDVDAYYNCSQVTTFSIPLDDIVEHFFADKYLLSADQLKNRLEYVYWTKDLEAGLLAHTLESELAPRDCNKKMKL